MTARLYLPLLLIALTGCSHFQPTVEQPEQAYACADWPSPPARNCDGGYCAVDVAVWLETEVKPAFDECKAVLERLRTNK